MTSATEGGRMKKFVFPDVCVITWRVVSVVLRRNVKSRLTGILVHTESRGCLVVVVSFVAGVDRLDPSNTGASVCLGE